VREIGERDMGTAWLAHASTADKAFDRAWSDRP